MEPHEESVGSIDWSHNLIATGSKDHKVALFDVR